MFMLVEVELDMLMEVLGLSLAFEVGAAFAIGVPTDASFTCFSCLALTALGVIFRTDASSFTCFSSLIGEDSRRSK